MTASDAALISVWGQYEVRRYDKGNSHKYELAYKHRDGGFEIMHSGVKSVTHYLGTYPKPWMKGWVAKTAVTALEEGIEQGVTGAELVSRVKGALWSRNNMDYGTLAHDVVLKYIMNELAFEDIPDQFAEACEMMSEFLRENELEAISTEQAVMTSGYADADQDTMIGGTFDLLVRDSEGRHGVLDLKFTSGVHPEHIAQSVFYAQAYRDMHIMSGGGYLSRSGDDPETPFCGVVKFPTPTNDGVFEAVIFDEENDIALMDEYQRWEKLLRTCVTMDNGSREVAGELNAILLGERNKEEEID